MLDQMPSGTEEAVGTAGAVPIKTALGGSAASRRCVRAPLPAIALVGVATLAFEILLTRIFSVTMWYHFAFVAVSLALFGIAASGLTVSLAGRFFRAERALEQMGLAALLMGLAIPLSFVLDLQIPFVPFGSPLAEEYGLALLPHLLFFAKFMVLAMPFFLSGVCISVAFTHAPDGVHRVYFADLLGASAGCLAVVPVLLILSGPSAVIATASAAFAAALLFFRASESHRLALCAFAGLALVVAFVTVNEGLGLVGIDRVKSYDPALGQEPERPKVYERWHPVSRIAVHATEASSSSESWFLAESADVEIPRLMEVTNDAGARTYLWPEMTDGQAAAIFSQDVSDLVYSIARNPSTLIIGVGGGKDILSALALGSRRVTGVELNPLMIDVVQEAFGDFTGRPFDDPRVELVVDEGRHHVARHPATYDVVTASVTDTWAASAGGGYALTENYLYTREAMHEFLDSLTPGGLLSITRWYPQETYRLAALAASTLGERGVQDPSGRVLMARNASTLSLIVKAGPITPSEEARFTEAVEQAGLVLVHSPRMEASADESAADAAHRELLTASSSDELAARLGLNVEPPTDDRPFFFNLVSFEQARQGDYGAEGGFMLQHGRALDLLWGLLAVTGAFAVLFVIAPLVLFGRRAASSVSAGRRLGANIYFLMLGLGYLLVEIPLLQQFILFLGHPTYAVTTVLFSMLVTSGIGSLIAGRLSLGARPTLFAAIVGVSLLYGALLPTGLRSLIGLPLAARVALAVAIIAPLGLIMGMPFPIARPDHGHALPDRPPGGPPLRTALRALGLGRERGGVGDGARAGDGDRRLVRLPRDADPGSGLLRRRGRDGAVSHAGPAGSGRRDAENAEDGVGARRSDPLRSRSPGGRRPRPCRARGSTLARKAAGSAASSAAQPDTPSPTPPRSRPRPRARRAVRSGGPPGGRSGRACP
jgi:hypothetical protein